MKYLPLPSIVYRWHKVVMSRIRHNNVLFVCLWSAVVLSLYVMPAKKKGKKKGKGGTKEDQSKDDVENKNEPSEKEQELRKE